MYSYSQLKEKTWLPLVYIKLVIESFKKMWIAYKETWFSECTWLIAWSWFVREDMHRIHRKYWIGEILKEDYELYLKLKD